MVWQDASADGLNRPGANKTEESGDDPVFKGDARWAVALLMIGACVGAVAVTAAYVFLAVVQLS